LGFLSKYKVEKWSVNGKADSTVIGSVLGVKYGRTTNLIQYIQYFGKLSHQPPNKVKREFNKEGGSTLKAFLDGRSH
jgi:hypothetical protein